MFIACDVRADHEGDKNLPSADALPTPPEGNRSEKERKVAHAVHDDELENILGLPVELSLDGEQAKVISIAYGLFGKAECGVRPA